MKIKINKWNLLQWLVLIDECSRDLWYWLLILQLFQSLQHHWNKKNIHIQSKLLFDQYCSYKTFVVNVIFWSIFKNTDTLLVFIHEKFSSSFSRYSITEKIFISNLKCCKYIGPKIFQTSLISSFGNFLKKKPSELLANSLIFKKNILLYTFELRCQKEVVEIISLTDNKFSWKSLIFFTLLTPSQIVIVILFSY